MRHTLSRHPVPTHSLPRRTPRPSFKPRMESLEERTLLSVDVILEWNAVALQANVVDHTLPGGTHTGPTKTARALAIVHAAMYDAINSIDGRYTPYLTEVAGAAGADIDAAAGQAAHDTLVALYPAQRASFDFALALTLARVPAGPAETHGIEVGRFVASRILMVRSFDGMDRVVPYDHEPGPGVHVADPLHPTQGYYGVGHGQSMPFTMVSGSQFRAPPPPALDSDAYAKSYVEALTYGGDGLGTPTYRSPEETTVGIFWGYDGSPGLGTPPRLYNQIARTLALQQSTTEIENARLFALANLAMADAGIAVWESKYYYNFWRPIVAIRTGDPSVEATPAWSEWTYLGAPRSNPFPGETNFTPNFPAYPSGHAGFGASMFRTLANFFGRDDISFTTGSDEFNGITRDQDGTTRPIVFRSYDRFSQAAEENGQSRIYLGIHWSFDKVYGIQQGNQVADYLFANYLRPRTASAAGLPADLVPAVTVVPANMAVPPGAAEPAADEPVPAYVGDLPSATVFAVQSGDGVVLPDSGSDPEPIEEPFGSTEWVSPFAS